MFVSNMTSPRTGNAVANQFIIYFKRGQVFQSYKTIIALIDNKGQAYLTPDWNCSSTTLKYVKQFLGTTASAKVIRERIEEGRYKVVKAEAIRDMMEGE